MRADDTQYNDGGISGDLFAVASPVSASSTATPVAVQATGASLSWKTVAIAVVLVGVAIWAVRRYL